jgi:hypothetical protein
MNESSSALSPTEHDQPFVPEGPRQASRAGSVALPDDDWYNLKFNYYDSQGKLQSGFAYYVGRNATWQYWDYISATPSNGPVAKFRKDSSEGNFMYLKTDDGYFLSCRAAPRLWLYRSSAYPIGWEIADGKLYTDYHAGAVGVVDVTNPVVPSAYYMQVDAESKIFNCEWIRASTQ